MSRRTDPTHNLDAINHATYTEPLIVQGYASRHELHPPERALLADYADAIRGARLLDLGVGAGRTTPALLALTADYRAIDYSPALVEAARERHPGIDITQGDARDLGRLGDASLDVVVFSFNGLDAMRHADRVRTLAEVHRMLADGGLFIFSTHNRAYERFDLTPWQGRRRWGRALIRECARRWRFRERRRRLAPEVVHTDEYAIINDDAHDYALLNYYITRERQVAQLATAGFETLAAYALDGHRLGANEPDTASVWLNYVARRSS